MANRYSKPSLSLPCVIGLAALLIGCDEAPGPAAARTPLGGHPAAEAGQACEQPPPSPGPPDLTLTAKNAMPTRLAMGPGGSLFVTDAWANSLFIYDANLKLTGQLRGLSRPLGVAVDAQGNLYVGNDGRDNVEVYSPAWHKLRCLGQGRIGMPNALTFDRAGNLYVVDSTSNVVRSFAPDGSTRLEIGPPAGAPGALRFPVDAQVIARGSPGAPGVEEIFVADQGSARLQVFDLEGRHLRSHGGRQVFPVLDTGPFGRLQALAVSRDGALVVLDTQFSRVSVLDPVDFHELGVHGSFGTGQGQLNVPLDVLVTSAGEIVLADSGNRRVEVLDVSAK